MREQNLSKKQLCHDTACGPQINGRSIFSCTKYEFWCSVVSRAYVGDIWLSLDLHIFKTLHQKKQKSPCLGRLLAQLHTFFILIIKKVQHALFKISRTRAFKFQNLIQKITYQDLCTAKITYFKLVCMWVNLQWEVHWVSKNVLVVLQICLVIVLPDVKKAQLAKQFRG